MTAAHKPKAPTRRDRSFHHQRPEYAENSFERHLADGTLTEDDVTLLREWLNEITAQNHLSVARVNKLSFQMVTWRRFIGPFRTNTIGDINAGVRALMTASSGRRLFGKDLPARPGQDGRNPATGQTPGKPYKRNTVHDLVGLITEWRAANGRVADHLCRNL